MGRSPETSLQLPPHHLPFWLHPTPAVPRDSHKHSQWGLGHFIPLALGTPFFSQEHPGLLVFFPSPLPALRRQLNVGMAPGSNLGSSPPYPQDSIQDSMALGDNPTLLTLVLHLSLGHSAECPMVSAWVPFSSVHSTHWEPSIKFAF